MKKKSLKKLKIIFWGNGDRAIPCLEALIKAGFIPLAAVLHPSSESKWTAPAEAAAKRLKLSVFKPDDPNAPDFLKELAKIGPDLFLLCGYGKILKPETVQIPKIMGINLHGGKLPDLRGSSPMNWALIKGEKFHTLSVVQVDSGIDSGPVLLEKTFPIKPGDTIHALHERGKRFFPELLVAVVKKIAEGTLKAKVQNQKKAGYYPLRFPDDGFILWDYYTAEEIHNRIRALTEPYPCAFTFWNGERFKLIASEMTQTPFYGEPGRIYRKTEKGLLVCAKDRALWILKTQGEGKVELCHKVSRYDRLPTLIGAAMTAYAGEKEMVCR